MLYRKREQPSTVCLPPKLEILSQSSCLIFLRMVRYEVYFLFLKFKIDLPPNNILIMVPLPYLPSDPLHFPSHPSPRLFFLSLIKV